MSELKPSSEIEAMIHAEQNELKKQIESRAILELTMAGLRREKIETKTRINDIDIQLSKYTDKRNEARDNITKHNINIKQFTSAFWASKNSGL
jgi:chromosome segregation ATPase